MAFSQRDCFVKNLQCCIVNRSTTCYFLYDFGCFFNYLIAARRYRAEAKWAVFCKLGRTVQPHASRHYLRLPTEDRFHPACCSVNGETYFLVGLPQNRCIAV